MTFWRDTPLAALDQTQWESLCDGCGRCCLHKIDDGEKVAFTCVACRLLDLKTVRCKHYAERQVRVPACVVLSPQNLAEVAPALPETCAYRRLHEGRDLPAWHPLISGDPDSVRRAGVSVHELAVPEARVRRSDSLSCYVTDLYTPPADRHC